MTKTPEKKDADESAPQFDDVLKRMLSSPPKQHKDERARPKVATKGATKKSSGK